MNWSEVCGLILGYILGIFTGLISFLRGARMFHPTGQLFEATVISQSLPGHALIRLSSAWWKHREWKDALGMALRFTVRPPNGTQVTQSDQDLLFVTFPKWWMVVYAPLLTDHTNFLSNHYYAIGKFRHEGQIKQFKIIPKNITIIKGTRQEKLLEAVLEGEAVFLLLEKELTATKWQKCAEIKITRTVHFDQERLRFNPFQNGQGITPVGFLQYLRLGSYRLSQFARPSSHQSHS